MALIPLSLPVEEALNGLDLNDRILRKYISRVFNPYKHWSYNDMFILGIVNRSMSMIFAFTTLVRSCNYFSAHHLIRLHLDSFLRFSVIWLAKDAQSITKRIYDGEQLNQIKRTRRKFYTDKFLAERAMKQYRWVVKTYDDLSNFVHLGSIHVFNSMEGIDDENRAVGLHGSKYDMKVTDTARLEGIAVMQKITDGIYDFLEKWCLFKEEKLKMEGENTIGDQWHPFTFLAMKEFTYKYQGISHLAAYTSYNNDEGYRRFRIMFSKLKGVVMFLGSDHRTTLACRY